MKTTSPSWRALLCVLSLGLPMSIFAQGSITPPGAPAPTMKSLDQVRSTGIALNATNTPGDANYNFVISAPGSYYLTGNLQLTKPNGIHVVTFEVTIDLNGFRIVGSGSGNGIEIGNGSRSCTIKNGLISNLTNGVLATGTRNCTFTQLTCATCSTAGMNVGINSEIDGCKANSNTGSGIIADTSVIMTNCAATNNVGDGLKATSGSLSNCSADVNTGNGIYVVSAGALSNCYASNNGGSAGISVGYGSTLNHCVATTNSSALSSSYGIFASGGSTLTGCVSTTNSSTSASTNDFTGAGISAGANSTLRDCSASSNKGSGIIAGDSSTIAGCTSTGNGGGATGSGIIAGQECTVSGCTSNLNHHHGITYNTGCFIVGNTAADNTGSGLVGTGINNTVDGNKAYKNHAPGIVQSAADADFTFRNVSNQNTTAPYSPVTSGSFFGPYSQPGTATSPWANF